MLDQVSACQKLWKHYAAILGQGRLSGGQLRDIAVGYLARSAPLEYLEGELLEGLVLSLHWRGLKVCDECFQLLPRSQFADLAALRCITCRRRGRAEYQAQWHARSKARRARYMREYRAQKKQPSA